MPLKVSSAPMGSWIGTALHFRRSFIMLNNIVEISAHDVHLVDISHSGNMVVVSLTPNSFGLRLNTALCTENSNRTVQNSQRTLNFNSKVNVSGGIDNVDTMAFPDTR